jgi:hypothetical protein
VIVDLGLGIGSVRGDGGRRIGDPRAAEGEPLQIPGELRADVVAAQADRGFELRRERVGKLAVKRDLPLSRLEVLAEDLIGNRRIERQESVESAAGLAEPRGERRRIVTNSCSCFSSSMLEAIGTAWYVEPFGSGMPSNGAKMFCQRKSVSSSVSSTVLSK